MLISELMGSFVYRKLNVSGYAVARSWAYSSVIFLTDT